MKSKLIALLFAASALLTLPIFGEAELFATPTSSPAEKIAEQTTQQMNMELSRRVMFRRMAWTNFWENPKASPQAILSALDKDAARVLALAAIDAAWFDSLAKATGKPVSEFIDPKYLAVKAGWTITPNKDGSATVAAPPEK